MHDAPPAPPDPPDPREFVDPELEALGFVAPDPDETPPVELWSAVGDVRPWGTLLLLLVWGAMLLTLAARHAIGDSAALVAWGASATHLPARASAWRLLASTFLHGGIAHAFFNALTMLVIGPTVERLFTRWGFWVVYGIGGAAASWASLAWRAARDGAAVSLSVGASGAIFALGGALLVMAIRLRRRLAPSRARAMGAALLLLIAPGFAAGYARHGTDNMAHAAGLVTGVLLGALLPPTPRLGGPPTGIVVRALATACAAALAISLALAVRSGLAL